jgi:hypothetical protein
LNGRAFIYASNAPYSPSRQREPQRVFQDLGGIGLLGGAYQDPSISGSSSFFSPTWVR